MRYGRHLERLAITWNAREYAESALLRGSALDEAISWTRNPDHLPSPLLQNYVAVSSEIRENFEAQRKSQSARQHRANIGLIAAFIAALVILVGGAIFFVETSNERDALAVLQEDTANRLATATTQNQALAV